MRQPASTREALTNDSGDYTLVEVQPGSYRVEFEQRGFKKNVQKNVTGRSEPGRHLNVTMQIGRDPGSG